jgi:uncharacterized protein
MARLTLAVALTIAIPILVEPRTPAAQQPLPPLTAPVNDFAGLIDPSSKAELDRRTRALRQATGDVIVVATIPSHEGYLDIRELAVKLFENGGRGIGDKGKDNGLLIVIAAKERRAAIEVGYDLEGIVTASTARGSSPRWHGCRLVSHRRAARRSKVSSRNRCGANGGARARRGSSLFS